MILNSITWLTGGDTTTLAIPTRSLDTESVTVPEGERIFFTVLLVFMIPLALIIVGFVIWYRRRKS
jgi:ABC-2 type transport system permease protein